MTKALTAALLCLCLAAIGCGGGADSDSATSAATTTDTSVDPAASSQKQSPPETEAKQAKGANPKVAKEAAKIKDTGAEKTPAGAEPAAPEDFKAPPGGDDSVQTFGEAAEGSQQEEVIASMRAFFTAMATLDYPAICAGLTEANRESLKAFLKVKKEQGGCEDVLEDLLLTQAAPEARRAANGSVLEVRVQDDSAFVLFTPEGGKASYFVMKSEEDGWKATGLAPGSPFDPTG